MKQKPTMADVARRAGVSPTTAARVLHDNGYVSETNRESVLKAAADLDYRPNIQARSLRYNRSFLIGVVLSSSIRNPFFARVSHEIQLQANAAGLSVLTFNHNYDDATEKDGLRRLLEHRVETLVLCHSFQIANVEPIQKAGISIIEIVHNLLPDSHKILLDPHPGLRTALQELYALGHRRVDFIGGAPAYGTLGGSAIQTHDDAARAEAFRTVALDIGFRSRDLRVTVGKYDEDTGTALEGLAHGRQILARSDRPTAVVTGSDVLAAGVLQAAYELKLRVPDDLSVIGYDDSVGVFLTPALSSVRQPYEDIGRLAIEIATTKNRDVPQVHTIDTRYTARSSVGPARSGLTSPSGIDESPSDDLARQHGAD